MSQQLILSLVTFAFVSAMTPGPNNTMLLTSGVNFGFRRTRPHVWGVVIGFTIMILAVALGVGRVFLLFPALFSTLRVVSIGYLLWLAWRIATAGTSNPIVTTEARPMTFFEAALFQWVNPKGWMVALSVAANFVSPDSLWFDAAVLTATFLAVSLMSATAWAFFGTSLRPLLADERSMRIFNVAMAVALVASLWPLVHEMI
ncbi:LysE family translocator [Hyphomicrobium sp.]|uniref:LysE family translocator n=1 Tax=Hyphomicrobium sp. TaxID=82 RepID=UPI001DD5DC15|nr:LysE family translocator [Hyphomicrobium sp.]MBY0562271.1 LysE family translocator [Hyphomicrobium sp.]